jgi:hypothetical protein
MFNILIILIAVINLTNSQESPEADDVAILSGLSTSSLSCSLKFDREFVKENEAIAAAIEELLEQRGDKKREQKSRDGDSTREPCDDEETDVTEEAATEAPDLELRRNLRKGNRRGGRGDDSTREPKDSTGEPRERKSRGDSTKDDVTREPCDDCKDRRKRKDRGDSDDSSDELATTAIPLRRLLREETERSVDATKEPCDRTREPCVGEDCKRGRKGRKGGRKSRKGEDATTEAPEDVPALRRALGRDGGRKRRKGIDATISNGLVEIAGVTGEVVFGNVDEALESIPLTLTIGETDFQCNVQVRGGNKVSCVAVSDDDFRVRVGCELEL